MKGGNLDLNGPDHLTTARVTTAFVADGVLLCCPGWSTMARSPLTATSTSWV
ncbi:PPIP5K2 isoform 18 [Pongo abelii]|uniref:PPIP5K2 isoform 18 n=1 Tax=Pongo abelii TaxID=9601 RepID=A0A2J8XEW3_PONAB|nr:PPIP5K2 isoform 18 [Pongo abelii]